VYITTIAITREVSFEAAAIEEYLLNAFTTRSNKIGNNKHKSAI